MLFVLNAYEFICDEFMIIKLTCNILCLTTGAPVNTKGQGRAYAVQCRKDAYQSVAKLIDNSRLPGVGDSHNCTIVINICKVADSDPTGGRTSSCNNIQIDVVGYSKTCSREIF